MSEQDLRKNDVKFFIDNYKILRHFSLDIGEKIILGNRKSKKCRFCRNKNGAISFSKLTHAIPELVGNKSLFSNYECNQCNKIFSETLEDNFGKFTLPWRTLTYTKGKKGIPIYKSPSKKSRIEFDDSVINVKYSTDDSILEHIEKENLIIIKTYRQPYIPLSVYKCLAKMAISIVPEYEISRFDMTIKWINDVHHCVEDFVFNPAICLFSFITGPIQLENPFVLLLRRKIEESEFPPILFILGFTNLVFQIFIPFVELGERKLLKYRMRYFPLPYGKSFVNMINSQLDLTSKTKVINEEVSIPIKYKYKGKQ